MTLKKPSWDFSHGKSGFRRDTITILFVFIHQFQIKAMQITKTYCNFPKPPSLIYQSHWTSIAPFMNTLSKKSSKTGRRRKKRRVWGSKQPKSFLLLFPPHLKTSSLYNHHHHWNSLYLGPQLPYKNIEMWMEPTESVCACSCVWSQDLVSPSVSQSNLASDAWCKHRVMRKDRSRQMFTVAMRFCLKWCILTWKELRIKH